MIALISPLVVSELHESSIRRLYYIAKIFNLFTYAILVLSLSLFPEDFLLELIRESNPRFGELGEELTEIITLENTMLDIIEDVQSFLEKEIQTFADPASVLASNSNKPQSLMSAFIRNNYGQGADNKQRKVPLRGEGKGSYGAQLSRFLQINDHFNRVCECNKLIVTIRKILIRTENYNSKIELIHERMKDFLPQYQTSLSCLNDTLRQIH
eukprot:GEZU01013708.1.p1 GENE.GEZU01013708.1~~GEZU01013708.1.p1  ORF type:complete len:212 (+),score=49.64 GEZU01013708.1:452-1087(+)